MDYGSIHLILKKGLIYETPNEDIEITLAMIMYFEANELNHDNQPHKSFSNFHGIGSGGSMNNPMYQKLCSIGFYEPQTGRNKKRYAQRERLKAARKLSSSYGRPRCKSTKGFI